MSYNRLSFIFIHYETRIFQVALGTDFPSKIVRLNLKEYGGKIICQKGALLCASHTVDITVEFTKKFSTGKSAFELFYHANSCVKYEVLVDHFICT